MLCVMIFCWLSLSAVRVASGLVRNNRMEVSHPSLRRTDTSFFPGITVQDSGPAVDAVQLQIDSVEEQLMVDPVSYDEFPQDMADAVQLQRRGTRSPGRCIPHQQSCLGHQLPCCDSCDTCYCRFFKAFCYCRSMDHSCKHRRA
ncbi:agouti-related protein isoform X1 [Tachysurus vachellii]|uniref:agouti-related protein isoform X1 n=1 Tax=Tachysurus vachellii TaxID=175792 RepID=UPI00296ACE03|nr:agouti-related protein isoform X1 [Tachysurus vachellii]